MTLHWDRVDLLSGTDVSGWVAMGERWHWVLYDHIERASHIWDYIPAAQRHKSGFYLLGLVHVMPSEEELFLLEGPRRLFICRAATSEYAKLLAMRAEGLRPSVGWDGHTGLVGFEV